MSDTQRTVWFLTAAWLSGEQERVGHIANRLAVNDMWFVRYQLANAMYPKVRFH